MVAEKAMLAAVLRSTLVESTADGVSRGAREGAGAGRKGLAIGSEGMRYSWRLREKQYVVMQPHAGGDGRLLEESTNPGD